MNPDVVTFLLILLVNFVITFLYWLFFFVIQKKYEAGFATRCMVMLLCPVIGPIYFFLGWILRKIFFHKPVELTDVIFSKDRKKSLLKADEERENNIVPIKDAVTVVDKQNARELILEVLRHDVRKSLSSLFLALNSDDSEISHYAASVLQSELGKFRNSVQNTVSEIDRIEAKLSAHEEHDGELKTPAGKEYSKILAELNVQANQDADKEDEKTADKAADKEQAPNDDLLKGREKKERKFIFADLSDKLEQSEDYQQHELSAHKQGLRAYYGDEIVEATINQLLSEQAEMSHSLIRSLYEVIRQNVLSEKESIHFTEISDKIALLIEKRDSLSAEEMAQIAECWRLRKSYDKCTQWSDRLSLVYPESLDAFSTKLKLCYDTNNREQFFVTLNDMKTSGVPLNHEMIEMVRVFN